VLIDDWAARHEVPDPVEAAAPVRAHPHPVVAAACAGAAAPVSPFHLPKAEAPSARSALAWGEACESPRLLTCCGAWRE
jgi:hypothetical protein